MKVFIGTLYCGENELEACRDSVRAQTHPDIRHEVIRDLPNLEAHQALYARFMELAGDVDIFLKLDADMVFENPAMVGRIVALFEADKEVDHCLFTVRDWYSQTDIMGLHAFSNRVRWPRYKDRLFVDPNPLIPGKRIEITGHPAPVALHNPDPSLEFAYIFGYHRALKVVQRDRIRKMVGTAEQQLKILKGVWTELKASRDMRRAAAIQGANDAFSGRSKGLQAKRADGSFDADAFARKPLDAFIAENMKQWEGTGYRMRALWQYGFLKYLVLRPVQFVKKLAGGNRS